MNEYPSSGDDSSPRAENAQGSDEQARVAAEAERRAAPISAGAPTGAGYPPRSGSSVSLGGPYPPAPYQPCRQSPPPYAPYPPYGPGPMRQGARDGRRVAPWIVVVGSLLVALAIIMAGCFIVAGVVQGMLWSSTPASATETHTFTVSGAPSVTLQMPAGNVHVFRGSDNTVTATLYKEVHAITHATAQQALNGTTVRSSQSGDTITLTVEMPSITGSFTNLTRRADLTLTVPASTNLTMIVNAGNADITGVTGVLDLTMNAGNLSLRSTTAEGSSSLRLNAGNVDYLGAIAPTGTLGIAVDAGNATVHLPPTTPTHLVARTSAGTISTNGWTSAQGTQGTTVSHGGTLTVDLNAQPTNTLTIQVSFGNVTVSPGAAPEAAPSA